MDHNARIAAEITDLESQERGISTVLRYHDAFEVKQAQIRTQPLMYGNSLPILKKRLLSRT